ncbi:MAG TPA: molecular chaperone TorD family protein [Pyrinomonadaceae bacterium]|jgi:TorA maturation chaperone TorD
MELFRALAVLAEPPGEEVARVAEALELGPMPGASEYTELFVFQLYPYASVYVSAEGMLGGEALDRISGFWRALSQTPPAEADHLAVMLALYARLCEIAADESDAVRRDVWERARKAFLWEHLLSWLPVYLCKLTEMAAPFYRRWSEVLMKALLAEARAVGQPEALPLHLRAATALIDPRQGGDVKEFLQSLLSPVRSGMILTRSDLGRAARRLGLGMRLGERAFILRGLFGQNASGMLEWLIEEASRWASHHQSYADSLGEVGLAWKAKALAAASLLQELKQEATKVSLGEHHRSSLQRSSLS